ncbi:MAG: aminotransferase class III-fold pyridoxal phosphate-dependent enzyme [Acidimicrobiia bacterium]
MPPAFLHPFASPASDDYTTIVRGEGAVVFDADGNRYVDALASLWYCGVGHGRQEMIAAITAQLEALEAFHTFERYTNEPAETLTNELASLAPLPGARVFLADSGSEAVDSAIKLARLAHFLGGDEDRTLIVSRQHAYHGVTLGGTSAQGLPANREGFGELLPRVEVEHDDLDHVERVMAERGGEVSIVLAEPVIGAGGVRPPEPGYLEGLRALCDEHGALLCFDEVICAFGRLGRWWGAERYGVVPDLVTFAKGVTSGYIPLGGVLVGRKVRERLEADPGYVLRHGHTYSGHPVACAAGVAAIDILRSDGLLERAVTVGERLVAGLTSLVDGERILSVRGEGALRAVELAAHVPVAAVRDAMRERGVISRAIPPSTIAFCPPLVIGDDDLDLCVEVLGDAIEAVSP